MAGLDQDRVTCVAVIVTAMKFCGSPPGTECVCMCMYNNTYHIASNFRGAILS